MATIRYQSWNEMLKERDILHTDYIRPCGNGFEVVRYSKWSDTLYFGYCGQRANTIEELKATLIRQGYNDKFVANMDICLYDKE